MMVFCLTCSLQCMLVCPTYIITCDKIKAIPVQPWTVPEGSRRLRLPDFNTVGTWKLQRPSYTPAVFTLRRYFWYSFLLEAESTPGPSCDRKDCVQFPISPSGTRDLGACSACCPLPNCCNRNMCVRNAGFVIFVWQLAMRDTLWLVRTAPLTCGAVVVDRWRVLLSG